MPDMQGQQDSLSESYHPPSSPPSPSLSPSLSLSPSPSPFSPSQSSPLQQQHDRSSRPASIDFETQSYTSEDAMDRPRTVSREGSVLRHPTPDLQSIQGAYVGNIERLEQSAERLSLSSDIGEELRKMRIEQRKSQSRRSSVLDAQNEGKEADIPLHRQFSYEYGSHASNSIVGTNNVARNGGFSSAAYFASPRSSVRSGSWSHQNSIKERSLSYGPRLEQVSEPEQEGKPLDSPLSSRLIPLAPQPESPTKALRVINDEQYNLIGVDIPHMQPDGSEMDDNEQQPRASSDTYRQASGLFTDFDGVHIAPHSDGPLNLDETAERRVSSQPIPIRPVSYMQPTPGENMVYYPAPVPMMLNLPKRLSKLPAAPHRDKRRSDPLHNLPTEARKSAAWLPDVPESANGDVPPTSEDSAMHGKERKRRTMAEMPPQLRATMFFDYPSTHQDVEVKGNSAVATLDSILDASAFAPVSAFTDHPIAGRVGAEVYGKAPVRARASVVPAEVRDPAQRRSTINLLTKRNSSSNVLENTKKRNTSLMSLGGHFVKRKSSAQQSEDAHEYQEADAADLHGEDAPLQRSDEELNGLADEGIDFHDAREMLDEEGQIGEPEEVGEYSGAPTTLLAELQLRKQQQKQRGRTAATAFPNGMHSTLLQLDAVAQVQKQSRRQKHTTLAWEDPEAHHLGAGDQDDEDVPLGVLFPGHKLDANDKSHLFDEDRPLGLIARRDMEDNEPLSHRRARLRGEEPQPRITDPDKRNSMYTLDLPSFLDEKIQPEDNDEDETLGQRIRRLKATNIPTQPRQVSGDFASEVLSQLVGLSPAQQASKDEASPPSKTPGPDETLGQRRKRLQREGNKSRNVSGESNGSADRPAMTTRHSMATILSAHPAAGASTRPFNEIKFAPAPKTRNTPWAMNQTRKASMGPMRGLPMASGLGAPGGGYANGMTTAPGADAFPDPMTQQPVEAVNPRQNEMIDRWRQSVMH